MKPYYTWIFNTYNDNVYVLICIIFILAFIIYSLDYWKQKKDLITSVTINPIINPLKDSDAETKSKFSNITQPSHNYQVLPILTNPANNLFISNEEKNKWKLVQSLLDGNEDSLDNTNGTPVNINTIPKNDILQINSTLFGTPNKNNIIDTSSTIGDYATLDTLGKSLTDTLGGINSDLGYTILEEKLGTFKKEEINNPHTYDNTSNYYTGMNANTVNGNNDILNYGNGFSSKSCSNGSPVFLQKDFDGVANIFAPNIIIQNPPLTSDGYPDISYRM